MNEEHVSIKTPEFVSLQFQPAGLGSRALAFMIDQVILIVINLVIILLLIFSMSGLDNLMVVEGLTLPLVIAIILLFIVNTCYFFVLEYFTGGRTVGKKLIGIRVIQESGHSITLLSSFIRNFLRLIDSLPTGYFVGILMIFFHSKHKRLGDVVGGTLVVHERRAKRKKRLSRLEKEMNKRGITKESLVIEDWAFKSLGQKDWNLMKAYSERLLHLPFAERDELTRKLAKLLLVKAGIEISMKSTYEQENMLLALYLHLKDEWEFEL
ncbi:RDD family protein [Evansella sp. AB-rgal1]|uniref:RDD family protein n=1 Tax=Evansella sp. AB-rgal1 TaxID=3242696 RepID=UPI00359E77B5